jgi:hypothetical protein
MRMNNFGIALTTNRRRYRDLDPRKREADMAGEGPFGSKAFGADDPQTCSARQARRIRDGAAVDVVLLCADGRGSSRLYSG